MASSTFHPFSRLPAELRLQIWEAACFPFQQHHKAIQYVEFFDGGDILMEVREMRHKTQDTDSDHSSNDTDSSAYNWDAGLWTTCKESREVILRHLKMDDPIKVPMDFREDSSRPVSRENEGHDVKLGYLRSQDDRREQRIVVRPSQDIFCIRGNNFDITEWSDNFLELYIPKVTNGWHSPEVSNSAFLSDPIWSPNRHSIEVSDIAFEFDPSWNDNWPQGSLSIDMMIEENSPRGILAKALFHAVTHNTSPQLWIIDSDSRWVRNPGQDHHTVYENCEDAYVEVSWEDTRSDTTSEVRWGFAREFIEHLNSLGLGTYFYSPPRDNMDPRELDAEEFALKDVIKLLVRRDNEIK